jgi:copper(I)-binding protein
VEAAQGTVRRAGIGLALAATLVASACAAGQKAQTADENESLDGTTARIGSITLAGLAIQSPAAPTWPKGSDAPLRVVIANSGRQADTLTSVTSPGFTGWQTFASGADAAAAAAGAGAGAPSSSLGASGSSSASGSSGSSTSIAIPAGGRASFGVPESERVLRITSVKQTLYPGSTIAVTFTFQHAGTVTAQVPVQLSGSPQSSVIPGPSATGQEG